MIGATAYGNPVRLATLDGTSFLLSLGKATVDRARAHLVLVTHLPVRDWWWLGLRLRCRHCGQRYPCPPRRGALTELAPR